jgi:hypothetical protein
MIRITQAILVILTLTATDARAGSNSLSPDFWLLGEFTQNAPCKGDGTDPAELKRGFLPIKSSPK